MKKEIYEFGTLDIGDHIIIGEINEGVDIQLDVLDRIIAIANETFHGEPWAYISNRINSYSTQPMFHMEINKSQHNMLAFAVVTNNPLSSRTAEYEETFTGSAYQFKSFSDLDLAVSWVSNILKQR